MVYAAGNINCDGTGYKTPTGVRAEEGSSLVIKKIPSPVSGGLILSYRCTAECRHCMYACTPRWKGGWITHQDLESILTSLSGKIQPSPYGPDAIDLNHGLHITGGEPFMNFDLLVEAVEMSSSLGIPSLFVETNCFWCSDDRTTEQKLRMLKEKGLSGILISVNPFYLEYVPFERTLRAVRISLEVFGDNTAVYQMEYLRRFKNKGVEGKMSFEQYLKQEGQLQFICNAEFFFTGRAVYSVGRMVRDAIGRKEARFFFDQPCRPGFLRNWHNHFDNYGNFIPGYCGGISLGDCRRLDDLLENGVDTDEYPVLGYLVDEDMRGLFDFAGELGFEEDREGYISRCHLCIDIRKYIVAKGEFPELSPLEFYEHLD